MERYFMFMGRKTQYYENDYATKCNPQIQCNPYLITNGISCRTRTKNFTIHMETQNTQNSQSSLEKEEWSWRNQPSWLQTILQNYSHQDSMVLDPKQKYRPMEQDRKPRNKPMHLWVPYFWQIHKNSILYCRIYNGAKTASSVNGAGKTGELHVKEWN